MPNSAGAAGGDANDATISTSPPAEPGCVVEIGDWRLVGDSADELLAIIDLKLAQAYQARDDADAAIAHWSEARERAASL